MSALPDLRVGGLVGFSTVDFPGQLAAVVFTQGCPWRCRYCHNPHLQSFHAGTLAWGEVLAFLRRRTGLLDAVVFSGGEPTAQPALCEAILDARALGYRIGLHTAGIYPQRLRRVLPLVDWVGLDVKGPLDARMDAVTRAPASARAARRALAAVRASGVPYELRTTLHPALHPPEARAAIQGELARLRVRPTRWQPFRPRGCADRELAESP